MKAGPTYVSSTEKSCAATRMAFDFSLRRAAPRSAYTLLKCTNWSSIECCLPSMKCWYTYIYRYMCICILWCTHVNTHIHTHTHIHIHIAVVYELELYQVLRVYYEMPIFIYIYISKCLYTSEPAALSRPKWKWASESFQVISVESSSACLPTILGSMHACSSSSLPAGSRCWNCNFAPVLSVTPNLCQL